MSSPQFCLADIDIAVCQHFGLPTIALKSRRRDRKVAYPRFAAIHLAREFTRVSLPQLGDRYHRDHTSILHGQRRALALIAERNKFAEDVEAVRAIMFQREPLRQKIRCDVEQMALAQLAATWA